MKLINRLRTFLKSTIKNYSLMILGYIRNNKEYAKFDEHTVFIYGIPEHGNRGDHAISIAEVSFMKNNFPNYNFKLIPEQECLENILCIHKITKKYGNVCVFHGGGNIGELYQFQEYIRQMAVKRLKKAKIVIFPQSIDYDDNSPGLSKAQRIYSKHPDLAIFTREDKSFEKKNSFFPKCKGGLVPDIVLSYNPNINTLSREGVIFCTRMDKEKNADSAYLIELLKEKIKDDYSKIQYIDTCSEDYRAPFDLQINKLNEIWEQFSSAEFVITDRLHGMIFAVITNTPCIAFDNSTGKVGSLYRTWLSNSSVIFVDDAESLARAKEYITSGAYKDGIIDIRKEIDQKFKPLKDYILKFR